VSRVQTSRMTLLSFIAADYISLYQQQREQLQRRYQEKDERIAQLTEQQLELQVRHVLVR
jgi:hypothetical protein